MSKGKPDDDRDSSRRANRNHKNVIEEEADAATSYQPGVPRLSVATVYEPPPLGYALIVC